MTYKYQQLLNIQRHKLFFQPNSKFNKYDVNMAESEEHDRKVMEQFFYLRRRGHFLAVRQKLMGGGVPDLAVLDTNRIMFKEVVCTETKSRLKKKKYPGKKIEVKT